MNRERWITSAATFLALWLIGAAVLAPGMRQRLEAAAHAALADHAALAGRLDRLELAFEGQRARLSGAVRTAQDRDAAVATVRDLVRAPVPLTGLGMSLNPVSAVKNEIEVIPFAPGWLMLAATGAEASLLGSAASEFEARDLARSLQETWSTQGGTLSGMPGLAPQEHDEAENVSATLRGAPQPQPSAMVHVARIGGPWQAWVIEQPDEELRAQALALGATEAEWQNQILPVVHKVRAAHEQQRQAAAEARRLAALPPGHVFIAARDRQVTLRGELATEEAKRALLAEALLIFAPHQVQDEVRVSSRRRPGGELPPVTTALLPQKKDGPGKTLFLAFDDEAWKPVDWQVAEDAQPWKRDLPTGVSADLVQQDSAAVISWLQGAAKAAAPRNLRPALVTLALFGGKAILSGQVAEESVRAQLISATRQAYSPHLQVEHEQLRLRGDCEPLRAILHAAKSLPPLPATPQQGLFAVLSPGKSWITVPATPALAEAGGLGKTLKLPEGLPVALVEECSLDALEQMRDWLSRSATHSLPR